MTSAAKVLLCELPGSADRFRELVDQAAEVGGGGRALAPEQVEDEALLLLNLSDTSEDRYRVFMDELPSFRATVCERHAQLAVVLAPHREHLLRASADRG